ncbi:MAG: hypothetical protein ACR2IT_09490, partial [Pirellulales bacterium]
MATQRTVGGRAGFIVASAFCAGLAFAILLTGPSAWDPPPESSFQIDDVAVEAEQPPLGVDDSLPGGVLALTAKLIPTKSLASEPLPAEPLPERLALAQAAMPIAAAIVAQALPTAGDRPDMPPPAPVSAPAAELVPTPTLAVTAAPAVPLSPVAVQDDEPITAGAAEEPTLLALVARRQTAPQHAADVSALDSTPPLSTSPPPLPGEAWIDPDGSNWTDSPAAGPSPPPGLPRSGRLLGRIVERRPDAGRGSAAAPLGGRLLDRVRDRFAQRVAESPAAEHAGESPADAPVFLDGSRWPVPASLRDQLAALSADRPAPAASGWSAATLASLTGVLETAGPCDAASEAVLITLGDRVAEGMH